MIISAKAEAREQVIDGVTRVVNGIIFDANIARETTDIDKYVKDFGVIQEFHIVARDLAGQGSQVEPILCHVKFAKQEGQDRQAVQAAIVLEDELSFTLRFALKSLSFETTMPIARITHTEERIDLRGEAPASSREDLVEAFKQMAAGDHTAINKIVEDAVSKTNKEQA